MSKFNKKPVSNIQMGYSENGNLQQVKSDEQQAFELVVTTLVGRDSFYSSSDEKAERLNKVIESLVSRGKYDFVANMLLFARTEMNIRNMPIYGLNSFVSAIRAKDANYPKLRNLTADVIKRPDQITDVLALMKNKSKMSMAVKRGLADAFNKFDKYQFAKWNRKAEVTLKDALRIVHPSPKDGEHNAIFKEIINGTLGSADTWEVALSKAGKDEKASKKEVWEDLISRNKLGYQATLKNLRNMIEAGVEHAYLVKVANYLVSNIVKSKALPFEFLEAIKAIEKYNKPVLNAALVGCMDLAAKNLPNLGRNVCIMLDTSSSMKGGYFNATEHSALEQAAFFAACLLANTQTSENVTLITFDSVARNHSVNSSLGVYANYQYLLKLKNGGSTNFQAAINLAANTGIEYDTVFVLTDGEVDRFGRNDYYYGSRGISDYEITRFQPQAKKFVINMEAGETTPLPDRAGWKALAGWSPKILSYIEMLEKGNSIIKMFNKSYPYTA